jgi:hypothetical protein
MASSASARVGGGGDAAVSGVPVDRPVGVAGSEAAEGSPFASVDRADVLVQRIDDLVGTADEPTERSAGAGAEALDQGF